MFVMRVSVFESHDVYRHSLICSWCGIALGVAQILPMQMLALPTHKITRKKHKNAQREPKRESRISNARKQNLTWHDLLPCHLHNDVSNLLEHTYFSPHVRDVHRMYVQSSRDVGNKGGGWSGTTRTNTTYAGAETHSSQCTLRAACAFLILISVHTLQECNPGCVLSSLRQ